MSVSMGFTALRHCPLTQEGNAMTSSMLLHGLCGVAMLREQHLCCCLVMMQILTCSAMDALAQTSMKGAAKCSKHNDLQNSVNQWVVECGKCCWGFPRACLRHCLQFVHRVTNFFCAVCASGVPNC